MAESTKTPKLEEARRRWGSAVILSGTPTNHDPQPAPEAPAAAEQVRRTA